MRSKSTLILFLTAIALLSMAGIASAEVETSADASVSIMSDYIWRGFNLGDDVAVQTSVGMSYDSFFANLWTDYDTDTSEHIETDLSIGYSYSAGKFGIEAGYIYYALDTIPDTQEVYIAAGYDILLEPSLSIYYDIDQGEGAYMEASVGHTFGFARDISLGLGALASYNLKSEYSIGDYSGPHHADLSAALSVPVGEAISIESLAAYAAALGEDAKDSIEGVSADGNATHFYGGISIGMSF